MEYKYDDSGRMTSATDGENEWIWEYDDAGNITHHIGPGNEFYKKYDEHNREVEYRCCGRIVTTEYDVDGVATQTEHAI